MAKDRVQALLKDGFSGDELGRPLVMICNPGIKSEGNYMATVSDTPDNFTYIALQVDGMFSVRNGCKGLYRPETEGVLFVTVDGEPMAFKGIMRTHRKTVPRSSIQGLDKRCKTNDADADVAVVQLEEHVFRKDKNFPGRYYNDTSYGGFRMCFDTTKFDSETVELFAYLNKGKCFVEIGGVLIEGRMSSLSRKCKLVPAPVSETKSWKGWGVVINEDTDEKVYFQLPYGMVLDPQGIEGESRCIGGNLYFFWDSMPAIGLVGTVERPTHQAVLSEVSVASVGSDAAKRDGAAAAR